MYVIPFTTEAGVNYEVRIGTGTRQTLIGAAQPFVTEEDDNDDMFFPVRLQTGYVRIVDTAGIWKNLMPATAVSLPVELYRGQMLMWRGFMKPETYSGALLEMPQERSFPIVCQLSVLESFNVESLPTNYDVNIAYILDYIFSKAGTFDYLYFQGLDAIDSWLLKRVSWLNFINTNADGQVSTKYNCLQLLEEICKFFGWTCRTSAGNVFFVAPTEQSMQTSGFQMISMADLRALADDYTVQPEDISWSNESITDFANDQNTEEYIQGISKATVTTEIDKIESIIEMPFEKTAKLFRNKQVIIQQGTGDNYQIYSNYHPTSYEDDNIIVDFESEHAYYPQNGGSFWAMEKYEGDISLKHNFNFRYSAYLACDNFVQDFSDYCMHIRTKHPYSFKQGMLTINGEAIAHNWDSYVVKLKIAIRIGGMYWNGSSWVNNVASFDIDTGPGSTIPDNRELTGPYDAYTGYGIPITTPMGGIVEIYILGVYIGGENQFCNLTSLKIGFALKQSESTNSDRDSNVYEMQNSNKFANSREVDLILYTNDNNAFGMNALMNADGSYANKLPYSDSGGGGTMERPEKRLAEMIAAYYSTPREKLVVNLLENVHDDFTPSYMVLDHVNNVNTYPIAISHDWAANIVTLTLMEI